MPKSKNKRKNSSKGGKVWNKMRQDRFDLNMRQQREVEANLHRMFNGL